MKFYEVTPMWVMDKLQEAIEVFVTDHRNGVTRSLNKLNTETTLAIIAVARQEADRPYESKRIDRFSFWYRENDESEDEANEYDVVSDVGYGETVTATD